MTDTQLPAKTTSSQPATNPADDVLEAKQRLLAYSQRRSGPNLVQRHPAWVAGAAVVLGLLLVRVPVTRTIARVGVILALREVGKSFGESFGRRF